MIEISDEEKQCIDEQINESQEVTQVQKDTERKLLRVLFWLGNEMRNLGYAEEFIKKNIHQHAVKIKFADDRWEYAKKLLLKYIQISKKIQNN